MKYTTIAATETAVKDYLLSLDDSELVSIHNQYCQNCNYPDDEIFTNDDDFFNTFFDGKVLEAVRAVSFGEYNYSDDYIMFNGYGNLITFNSPTEQIDIDAIVAEILENPQDFDIELEEVFEIDGTKYEGTEEDAKEAYQDYKTKTEDNNSEAETEDEKEPILSFSEWAKEYLTEIY